MAAPIRFDGLLSGINYSDIIDKLVSVERQPIDVLKGHIDTETKRKTAFLDLSASLLGLKTAADTLAQPTFFSRTTTTSGDPNVLLASGDLVGSTGSFTFSSARLARAHQSVSTGFAAKTSLVKPAGQGSQVSIGIGTGFVDRATRLSDLNGGLGVDRGRIKITDRVGGSAVIDLTSAVTVQDVIDQINGQASANVRASAANDRILIEDQNGTAAAGSLTVANVGDDTTATDLGLEGTRAAGVGATLSLFGLAVNRITGTTMLDRLNDGLGVRHNGAGSADFTVTRTDGTSFSIDLTDDDRTVQAALDKINAAGAGTVTASINAEGNGIDLVDTAGGAGALAVASSGYSNAAHDLGLLVAAELKGAVGAPGANFLHGARVLAGIDSILRRTLNGGSAEYGPDGGPFVGDFTGVKDGSVTVTDRSGASSTIGVVSRSYRTLDTAAAAGSTTLDLDSLSGVAVGNQVRLVNAATGETELRNVKRIVDPLTATVELDQATGIALTVGSFAIAQNDSLSDVQNQFRNDTGVKVDLRFNKQGTGLLLADRTGATAAALTVTDVGAGTAAADLGIRTEFAGTADASTASSFTDDSLIGLADGYFNGATATVTAGGVPTTRTVTGFDGVTGKVTLGGAPLGGAVTAYAVAGVNDGTFSGRDLHPQVVGEATGLATLNQGAGVFKGRLRVTDTSGGTFTVDLSQDSDDTIADVLRDINGAAGAAGSGVKAGLNAAGNGLLLTDTTPGAGLLRVDEVAGGTTAHDLGIARIADAATPATIDGSFERTFAVGAATTLQDLVDAINASGIAVTASIVNDGSGASPFRLSLVSKSSGEAGRLSVQTDIRSLAFNTATRAQDAVLLYGTEAPGSDPVLLTSGTNTFRNVVPGLTLDLVSASSTPTTVTVARDVGGIVDQVKRLSDSYDSIVDKIRSLTKFDTVTNKRALLFGDSALQGIERGLKTLFTQPISGIPSAKLNTLAEVGLRLTQDGRINFDSGKLEGLLATNFDEVKDLFTRPRLLEATTPLKDLNEGRGVSEAPGDDFKISTRSGASFTVDLAGAQDVQGVLNAINLAAGNGGKVLAVIAANGKGLQLTDATVPTGVDSFKVAAVGSSTSAAELGILVNAGTASATIVGGERLLSGDPGAAGRLSERLQSITDDPGGVIATRTGGLDRRIGDFQKTIDRVEDRVKKLQDRLVRQFTSLEKFLGAQESARSTLSGQLTRIVDQFGSRQGK